MRRLGLSPELYQVSWRILGRRELHGPAFAKGIAERKLIVLDFHDALDVKVNAARKLKVEDDGRLVNVTQNISHNLHLGSVLREILHGVRGEHEAVAGALGHVL